MILVHSEAREQDQRDRVPCLALGQALRRVRVGNLARHQRIVSRDLTVAEADIGPRSVGLLSRQGEADQEFVELPLPARELIDLMFTAQRLDNQIGTQRDLPLSKMVGSVSNLLSRG